MSEANRVALRYNATEQDGTPITPAGDAVALAFTSESFVQETDTVNSELIRDDRQIADHVRTNIAASGTLEFELLYAAFDQLFEAALQSVAWTTPHADVASNTTLSCVNATNEIRSTTTGLFATVTPGAIIRITGFTDPANNGYARVESVGDFDFGGGEVDNTLVLSKIDLVDEAAGDSVTIEFSAWITNGTRQQLFTIEREYGDLASEFALFTKMVVDQMALEINAEEIVGGSFEFMGEKEASAAATFVSGSETPVPGNEVFNAVDNVARIVEGASLELAADQCVTALSINLNNNSRARNCIGKLGPESHGSGSVEVSGTLSVYYASKALADKHLNYTTTSLFVVLRDSTGKTYVIELPRVKITSSPRGAGGINTDIVVDYDYAAFRDATTGWTIRIHRLS